MTSLQIQYFLKVADCMSFSQAADELYVSQPSVSRQIQQLEHELGCALFDRSRKNAISLTPAGMVFRDSFRRSLRGFEEAKAAARELSENETLPSGSASGRTGTSRSRCCAFRSRCACTIPRPSSTLKTTPFAAAQSGGVRPAGRDPVHQVQPSEL